MNLKSGCTKLKGTPISFENRYLSLYWVFVFCACKWISIEKGNCEAPRHKWKQLKTQTFAFFMGRKNKRCFEGRTLMNF